MSSLLDSLLLDPYRDPREIWIARRTDGQVGTGTIADPFDGSRTLGLPLVAQLTLKWNEFVVELGDVVANLPNFDVVKSSLRFEGVTGPAKDWFNYSSDKHNEFRIVEVTRFNITSNGPSALGFVVEPVNPAADFPEAPPNVQFTWNGYVTASYTDKGGILQMKTVGAKIIWPVAKLAFSTSPNLVNFDAVELSGLDGSNSHFNGTYALAGLGDKNVRIRLSDRFLDPPGTDIAVPLSCVVRKLTYRFDQIMRAAPEYALIHLGPGTFETRGSTPDYISNQDDYRQLFVGFVLRSGQRLRGSGIGATVLQLDLAVAELGNTAAIGNFTVADFAEVSDLTVDCNAAGHPTAYGIFPAPLTCGAVTLFGSFIALRRVRAIHFCCQAVAESFVLSIGATAGTFNVIEDCILERPGENNTHETTLIASGAGDHRGLSRSPVIRHNYVNCELSSGSTQAVAVESYARLNDHEFTVTFKSPHQRVAGQNIRFNGAKVQNGPNPEPNPIPPFYFFDDTFEITQVISSVGLKCYSPSMLPAQLPQAPNTGYIGVDYHGPAAFGGTGCVTEANALYDCLNAFYSDTGATRDGVVRDNYYSGVGSALFFNYPSPGVESPRDGASLKRDPDNHKIAIFEAPSSHFVSPGMVVTITGARVGGSLNNPYNDNHRVIAVSADASGVVRYFRYEMKAIPDPDQDADAPSAERPLKFAVRWQNPRHSFERNAYDLYPYDDKSPVQSAGFSTFAYTHAAPFTVPASPPYIFPDCVFRENLLRLRDNAVGQTAANGGDAFAFRLDSFEKALIEENVIHLPGPFHIHHLNSQAVHAFNNRTPASVQEPLFEDTSGVGDPTKFRHDSGLDDNLEDALILSVL